MAHKRKIRTTADPTETEEEVEETWGQWAARSYARAWYIVLCLFIDIIFFLEVMNGPTFDGALGLGVIVLLLLIMAQAFVYMKLWGRNGRWARDR